MNFGIIGFGRIARKFCESIKETEGKVYAIASHSVKEDDPYLLQNPDVKVYHDYEALLNDPNVEAVYIAVPHKFHKQWVIAALKHHKAVLCEKPAVLSSKDMKEIRDVAYQEKTYFLEALKTKLNDGMEHLKQDLALIGEVKTIEANFCSNALMAKGTDSFLFDKEQGGALNDVGPYLVGFALDLIDSPVKDVQGLVKVVDDIEEHFFGRILFENKVEALLEGAIDEQKDREAMITGTLGQIKVPMFNRIISYTIYLPNEQVIERNYPIKGTDMTKQIQCLIDDVHAGKIENDRHSLQDSIDVISVMEQIR